MRLCFGQLRTLDEETLTNARQLGIEGVHYNLPHDLKAQKYWKYEDLLGYRESIEKYGLKFEGMENLPISFYDHVMLGEEGREEQMDNVCESIRNLGRAGIPVLGYHFSPSFVWRTSNRAPKGRYGALVQEFILSEHEKGIDDMDDFGQRRDKLIPDVEFLWENYAWFLERVIPVCEEYNVTLALHPDDPPIRSLSGIARLFVSVEDYKRAREMTKSKAWGILLCIATFAEMEGGVQNVFDAIQYFGPKKDIIYAHMRDISGTIPSFRECLMGDGICDAVLIMKALKDNGFDGFIMSDHVPAIMGDTPWGLRARIHDTAYLKGIIETLNRYPIL